MGRQAKYLTDDERVQARKEWRAKYNKSERGKKTRSEQNHRAYEKRRNGAPRLALRLPYIPLYVRQLAALPLPVSHPLFRQHDNEDDEDDPEDQALVQWEQHPPYNIPQRLPPGGLEELSAALHGRRYRLHREFEEARLTRLNAQSIEAFTADVHRNLMDALKQCQDLKQALKPFKASHLDLAMGNHLLQWKARRVVYLVEDWKALKKDKLGVVYLYGERW